MATQILCLSDDPAQDEFAEELALGHSYDSPKRQQQMLRSPRSAASPGMDDDAPLMGNPGKEILKPGPHDMLLGRGGGTNNHSGNVKFRKLVNEHKMRYLACRKVEKPMARDVEQLWRKMVPPGRFLARKDETKKGPGSVKETDSDQDRHSYHGTHRIHRRTLRRRRHQRCRGSHRHGRALHHGPTVNDVGANSGLPTKSKLLSFSW